jgi:hypothetical protein
MQAWFNLLLAVTTLRPGRMLLHERKNGAATPATVAVRRNWRRDQGVGAEWRVSCFPRQGEEAVFRAAGCGEGDTCLLKPGQRVPSAPYSGSELKTLRRSPALGHEPIGILTLLLAIAVWRLRWRLQQPASSAAGPKRQTCLSRKRNCNYETVAGG